MSDLWNSMQIVDSGAGRNSFAPPAAANLADLSTMPWSTPNPCHVMEFTAIAPVVPSSTPHLHAKRKPTFDSDPVPVKKLLTEDSMAEHLSNLRISGEGSGMEDSCLGPGHPGESLSNYTVNMSQWDLEKKLRTAQKITVCNEILELDKERDSILPEILLNRMTKPCSALMLWQPPPTLSSLIDGQSATSQPHAEDHGPPKDSPVDEMET